MKTDRFAEQAFIGGFRVFVRPHLKMPVGVNVVFLGDYLGIAEIVLPCHLAAATGKDIG